MDLFFKNKINKSISGKHYFPKWSLWIFAGFFIVLFYCYHFNQILFFRPQSVHQWRQCDCLSTTFNYYQNNLDFFSPQIHYIGSSGNGKAVSDCPILYYGIAKLWKLFGYHEYIYRAVVLILTLIGLMALLKTIEDILKDSFMAIFLTLLLYTSPILVYYSNNFLMNVPSFSVELMGLSLFYRYFKTKKSGYFIFSMFFYALASLLKITALSSFTVIICLFLLENKGFLKSENGKSIFIRPVLEIAGFLIVIIIVVAWYLYALNYNKANNGGIFLIGILPVWELSTERILHVAKFAYKWWFESYFSAYIQYFAIAALIYILLRHKKINRPFLIFMLLMSLGFLSFIVLWYNVFEDHDYYLVNQLLLIIVVFVIFFQFLKTEKEAIFRSYTLRIILVFVLIQNIFHCRNNIETRYFGWMNDGPAKLLSSIEGIGPVLDSAGIGKTDRVLFMNDASFNISLYLMNRPGFTAETIHTGDEVKNRLKAVNYLLLNDSMIVKKEYIKNAVDKKVGQYRNILIFRLKSGN
ncbi:MAG: glycosyltransferase family 39 protein [Bacteroidales bacterium]